MNLKMAIAVIAVLGLLAVGTLSPKAARADTTEALLIAGAVTAGYVAVVIFGTMAYRKHRGAFEFALAPPETRRDHTRRGLQLGGHCRQRHGSLTLACW